MFVLKLKLICSSIEQFLQETNAVVLLITKTLVLILPNPNSDLVP